MAERPGMSVKDKVRSGVAVCTPLSGRAVPAAWAFAYKSLDPPINTYSISLAPEGLPVDKARNWCVERAQENNCKWLFFMDEDTIVPPQSLRRFIFHLENNPQIDVIGGVYCSKSDPPAPLVFKKLSGHGSYWDWKVGEMFEVEGLGMGCTMIRMTAFDKIKPPYFLTISADAHADGIARTEAWTEDLYFCDKIIKAGGHILCDGSILCDHVDVNTGTVYRLPPNSKPAARYIAPGSKKILDIGCGGLASQFPEGQGVRFDIREGVNPDYRGDCRALPFATESWDIVFASHILEHFNRNEVSAVLDEWLRVLKVGGQLRLAVPDLVLAARNLIERKITKDTMNILYGEQSNPWDFHRIGFTEESLYSLLKSKGLKVNFVKQERPLSIVAEAVKVKAHEFVGEGQGRAIRKADPEVQKVLAKQKELESQELEKAAARTKGNHSPRKKRVG